MLRQQLKLKHRSKAIRSIIYTTEIKHATENEDQKSADGSMWGEISQQTHFMRERLLEILDIWLKVVLKIK